MIYYHGSKRKLDVLVPQQAEAGDGLVVPEGELLKAIYLTPNREYAIAMAARPDGIIAPEHIHTVDDLQTAVVDIPEIIPLGVEELKAGELEQYYELTNWKREGDMGQKGEPLNTR